MNRFYLIFLDFLLLGSISAKAQGSSTAPLDSLKKINLKIISSAPTKFKLPGYYLAMEYNFADSILVYVNGTLISHRRLPYSLPDKDSEIYPDNRLLLKLKMPRKVRLKYCTVVFLRKKCYMQFKIYRKITYYSFGMDEHADHWTLDLLKTFPWPD
jgi:hypothetical protein